MNDFLEQQTPQESLSPSQEAFVEKIRQLLGAQPGEYRFDARHYLVVVRCGTVDHLQISRRYAAPVFRDDGSRIPSYFNINMDTVFDKDPQSEVYTIGMVQKTGEHLDQTDCIYFGAPDGPRVDLKLVGSKIGNRVLVPMSLQYSKNGEFQGIHRLERNSDGDWFTKEYVSLHHLQEYPNPFPIEFKEGSATAEYNKITDMVTIKTVDEDKTIESIEVPAAVNVEEIKEKLFPHDIFADPYKATAQDDGSWHDVSLRRTWGIKPSLPPGTGKSLSHYS